MTKIANEVEPPIDVLGAAVQSRTSGGADGGGIVDVKGERQ